MTLFPSEEWTKEFIEAVNASEHYRDYATDWEGDVTFVFEAEPDNGVPENLYGWFDLWHGECRDWTYGTDGEKPEAARFVIRAPYSRWKEVIKGELEPVKGMMQGKIKLRGDLPTIVRYAKASNELVTLASKIPTEFPDEQ